MRKETMHNTILRIAKEPKGRKATTKPNQGPVMWRKRAQTQMKRSPNGVKLHRDGPYIPRGPPGKDGGKMGHPRCGYTLGVAAPPLVPLASSFHMALPGDLPKAVAC